ncbi:nudC domain-containing protein 3 isoform X2 [Cuculus canorus]|uniref:nudC domain-containing protein 3 isoform X2 n=1 Tax=Cuculus canorus TaxID=55661 RepID=UPI0023AAD89A|nr:nudC domain-containing protein 3 isoform X2 [Cuculus canorus]
MEAALTDLYDPALLGILQHVGNVEQFLRVLFGFLYRKTDFYRLLLRPGDRLGFPPGAARAMALQAFQVFEQMARQDDEKRRQELEAKLRKKEEEEEAAAAAERMHLSSAVQEVEVETTAEYDTAPAAEGAAGPPESAGAQDTGPSPALAEPSAATASAEPPPAARPAKQEQFQTDPDSYNGAVRENYAWSQDYSDLEIKVPVPKHIVKGKQVSVDISSSTIRVAVLEGSSQHVLMEGKLTHKINTESCLWSLEPGKCILINLNKGDEYWWNAILEGEEQIDIDKINKERSMATVDEEEHAVLDRLTFDYHQKLQGKPQSHELKVHEMLKKGWDTEGSPFRGQKFDPSMFNISPGAVQF